MMDETVLLPLNSIIEFVEHPQDAHVTSKAPAIVECLIKNAHRTSIECNNKVREQDVKRNEYLSSGNNNDKYERLTLVLKKKEFDAAKSSITRRLVCRCVAYSASNDKFYSFKATIRNAYLEHEFQSEPMDETSYEGETIEMRCDPPRGEPMPSVHWLRNNREIDAISDPSSRYKLSNDFSLLILVARKEDEGDYVCLATNMADTRMSKPARLTLLDSARKYFWSDWSEWSACSAKCGSGTMKRFRTCQTTDKLGELQNVSISMCGIGQSVEDQPCNMRKCPKWSEWSDWSACDLNECKQYRRRTCGAVGVDDSSNCIGEKVMARNCSSSSASLLQTSKLCISSSSSSSRAENAISFRMNHLNNTTETITTKTTTNNTFFTLDKSLASFLLGISAGLLLLALFTCILMLFIQRRRRKYSNHNLHHRRYNNSNKNEHEQSSDELNLYYTCEKQQHQQLQIDDDYSLFKFTNVAAAAASKASPSTTSNSNASSSSSVNINNFLIKQQHQHQHQPSMNNPIMRFNRMIQLGASNCPSPQASSATVYYATPFENNNNNNNTNNLLNINNKIQSAMNNNNNNNNNQSFKIVSINNRQFLKEAAVILTKQKAEEQDKELAYDVADALSFKNLNQKASSSSSSSSSSSTSGIATASPSLSSSANASTGSAVATIPAALKNLFISIDQADICAGNVSPLGAKLSLDSGGITLIVPEGALEQSSFMYLALCRQNSFKPKLNNEKKKSTLLSEVLLVGGPPGLKLRKPVMLIMDHCAKCINKDWQVTLHSATNSYESTPDWKEETHLIIGNNNNVNSDNNSNNNNNKVFLNATENHFVILTEKLARFALTGESTNNSTTTNASKYIRLVAFCSSSITNNDLNLRIYCIDNLKLALEEVLRDERKIGGTHLETSDPFLISQSQSSSIKICIEELVNCWNCKYNVNKQEIPFNHIWNGRSNLLHCSFTLEQQQQQQQRNQSQQQHQQLKCKIRAFQSNNHQQQQCSTTAITMIIDHDIHSLNNQQKMDEVTMNSRKNYLRDYSRIDRETRKQICIALDRPTADADDANGGGGDDRMVVKKNWISLANKLDITANRGNLAYFASKPSPTEYLLLYFEALNNIKDECLNSKSVESLNSCFNMTAAHHSSSSKKSSTQQSQASSATSSPSSSASSSSYACLISDIKYQNSYINHLIERLANANDSGSIV